MIPKGSELTWFIVGVAVGMYVLPRVVGYVQSKAA